MLDAFIIDKIRRERESREQSRVPLQIEVPRPHGWAPEDVDRRDRREEDQERGVVIIDFTI